MKSIPKRDITGKCRGECRDRVRELQTEQQETMNRQGMRRSTEETPGVEYAKSRTNAPGDLGGHV